MIPELSNLPEISFADTDVNEMLNSMVSDYEQAYYESTGERKKLYAGDPIRIFLYTQALRELQLRSIIDDAAKQNLLAYARRPAINHLAAFKNISEFQPQRATTLQRFYLSAPQAVPQTIPAGTRVSPGNKIFFEVQENHEIPAGDTQIDIVVRCTIQGEEGNGFTPGQIDILVNPIPWVERVENIETSQGGSGEEDLESLRERIWLAPETYSVAGPKEAYESMVKQYSPLITNVKATTPHPGVTDIRFLLENGEVPTDSFSEELINYLSEKDKRPLTDNIQGGAPEQNEYNIDVTYYIRSSDSSRSVDIQNAVENAVQLYRIWQKSKIGRDINPSELQSRIIQAGAKRAEIIAPSFTVVPDINVANDANVSVNYGGMEDD
ncbi:baseplate assembly protein [Salibacterium halotolerans]|uniref:Phage-related baseplate assembly protein n=1 Tax=Salibacterium halotolerans TaxID=1884432 RepID=A0A1I5MPK7_9BACI|nr:baseplate J/gp47 family protein [Salibacterium halotolerans]SFP11554.1 Phage-related baseplate assembly protein [Salibacterium halotolerans]